MKCPHCQDVELAMTHRQDIEIDYCPRCRGVWLDRGELDKVIERSAAYAGGGGGGDGTFRRDDDDDDDDDDDRRRRAGYGRAGYSGPPVQQPPPYSEHPHGYRKKKSFWSELFD